MTNVENGKGFWYKNAKMCRNISFLHIACKLASETLSTPCKVLDYNTPDIILPHMLYSSWRILLPWTWMINVLSARGDRRWEMYSPEARHVFQKKYRKNSKPGGKFSHSHYYINVCPHESKAFYSGISWMKILKRFHVHRSDKLQELWMTKNDN